MKFIATWKARKKRKRLRLEDWVIVDDGELHRGFFKREFLTLECPNCGTPVRYFNLLRVEDKRQIALACPRCCHAYHLENKEKG